MLVIRREQLHILARDLRNRSVKDFVRKKFPKQSTALGQRFPSVVDGAMARAAGYGFSEYHDVLRFVILEVVLDENFEQQPAYDWATEILSDQTSPLRTKRASRLYHTAIRQLNQTERNA